MAGTCMSALSPSSRKSSVAAAPVGGSAFRSLAPGPPGAGRAIRAQEVRGSALDNFGVSTPMGTPCYSWRIIEELMHAQLYAGGRGRRRLRAEDAAAQRLAHVAAARRLLTRQHRKRKRAAPGSAPHAAKSTRSVAGPYNAELLLHCSVLRVQLAIQSARGAAQPRRLARVQQTALCHAKLPLQEVTEGELTRRPVAPRAG